MKIILAGLAAAAVMAGAASQPAVAMPAAKVADQAHAATSNIIDVQYRRHYRRGGHYRHYGRGGPRWGYVGPRPYRAWGYPYRHYPYPYSYYGGPGFGVQVGPFGFGLW